MRIEELNAASRAAFCAALAGIWEHSPWIVEAAAGRRPFANRGELMAAMAAVVRGAGEDRQVALLRAHPDLAGRLARARALTAESTGEQASVGLDRLSPAEFAAFTAWNQAYRARFGFPFVICARDHTRASIAEAFVARLKNARAAELQTALDEVRKIAEYRLKDRIPE